MSAAGAITLTSKASRRSAGLDAVRGAERLYRGGVVDQDVDAARRECRRHGTAAVFLVGQVGGQHADPPGGHATFAQQGAGLLQLRRGAGEQDHPGAGVAKPERDGAPDAASGPGDQRGLASEVICHCGLLNG